MLPVAWSIDKPGVIARSAHDCRTVLAEIVGADPKDPTSADWRPGNRQRGAYRIGILPLSFDGYPATGHRFEAALDVLGEAGMDLREVTLPDGDFQSIVSHILAGETAAAQESLVASGAVNGLLDSAQRAGIRRSVRGRVVPFARALRDRVAATRAVRSVFADVDALVAPTSVSEAPGIGTDLNRWPPRRRHYGFLGALAGLPGVSVPMGLGDRGLPLGMTVMADVRCDDVALDIAEEFQRQTDWHLLRPEPGVA
jgi:aspartyl-tRNA(Asn)/glutamyl-tRNA(Gln) amidotransferase subunit A